MKTVSSSLMGLLVVAALFFGNCFSCPQMLLAQQSHQPYHSCCHKPKPACTSCQAQGMQHFVKAGDHAAQPLIVPTAAGLIAAPTLIAQPNASSPVPSPSGHAPPGVLSLRI
jgi:hypothetical protein